MMCRRPRLTTVVRVEYRVLTLQVSWSTKHEAATVSSSHTSYFLFQRALVQSIFPIHKESIPQR